MSQDCIEYDQYKKILQKHQKQFSPLQSPRRNIFQQNRILTQQIKKYQKHTYHLNIKLQHYKNLCLSIINAIGRVFSNQLAQQLKQIIDKYQQCQEISFMSNTIYQAMATHQSQNTISDIMYSSRNKINKQKIFNSNNLQIQISTEREREKQRQKQREREKQKQDRNNNKQNREKDSLVLQISPSKNNSYRKSISHSYQPLQLSMISNNSIKYNNPSTNRSNNPSTNRSHHLSNYHSYSNSHSNNLNLNLNLSRNLNLSHNISQNNINIQNIIATSINCQICQQIFTPNQFIQHASKCKNNNSNNNISNNNINNNNNNSNVSQNSYNNNNVNNNSNNTSINSISIIDQSMNINTEDIQQRLETNQINGSLLQDTQDRKLKKQSQNYMKMMKNLSMIQNQIQQQIELLKFSKQKIDRDAQKRKLQKDLAKVMQVIQQKKKQAKQTDRHKIGGICDKSMKMKKKKFNKNQKLMI